MRFDYKLYKPRRRIGDTAVRLNKYFRSPDIQLSPLSKIGDLAGNTDKPDSAGADKPRFIFGRDFDRTRLAFAPSKSWRSIYQTQRGGAWPFLRRQTLPRLIRRCRKKSLGSKVRRESLRQRPRTPKQYRLRPPKLRRIREMYRGIHTMVLRLQDLIIR
jgi:hypothetical protein